MEREKVDVEEMGTDNQVGKYRSEVMEEMGQGSESVAKRKYRGKVRVIFKHGMHSKPMNPDDMDGRFGITQAYKEKLGSIIEDLGGMDNCSVLQLELARREAWASLWLGDFEMRFLAGYLITDAEFDRYIHLKNSSSRNSGRLGLKKLERKLPSLEAYLRTKDEERKQDGERPPGPGVKG